MRRAAHTLKSNANTFGALPLGERCAALELSAKAGDFTGAVGATEAIATELSRVDTDLWEAWEAISIP